MHINDRISQSLVSSFRKSRKHFLHKVKRRIKYNTIFLCVCYLFSHVWLFATPWTARLLCPWNSPGKNSEVGCHFLLQGNLPNPGIEPESPILQAHSLPSEPPGFEKSLFKQPPAHVKATNDIRSGVLVITDHGATWSLNKDFLLHRNKNNRIWGSYILPWKIALSWEI